MLLAVFDLVAGLMTVENLKARPLHVPASAPWLDNKHQQLGLNTGAISWSPRPTPSARGGGWSSVLVEAGGWGWEVAGLTDGPLLLSGQGLYERRWRTARRRWAWTGTSGRCSARRGP